MLWNNFAFSFYYSQRLFRKKVTNISRCFQNMCQFLFYLIRCLKIEISIVFPTEKLVPVYVCILGIRKFHIPYYCNVLGKSESSGGLYFAMWEIHVDDVTARLRCVCQDVLAWGTRRT